MKCEKGIKREPGNEKPEIINKIVKNVKDINRKNCGNLNRYVKRQGFKNPYGSKPALIFRDISFILPNLTLLNLILLGMSHLHVLNYGLYQI